MPEPLALRSLTFRTFAIPFTTRFRHASADRGETSSVWVEATCAAGLVGHGESCPRPYVTGETLESAAAFFHRHSDAVRRTVECIETLARYAEAHLSDIDANPAAWCAIELAVLDLVAQSRSESIEATLSRPPLAGEFMYSAVVGDADAEAFARQVERYLAMGFRDFKIKLSGDANRDRAKVDAVRQVPDTRLRVDANNLWRDTDEAIAFLRGLGGSIAAVEEPLAPGDIEGLLRVALAVDAPIVLDESVSRASQLTTLPGEPGHWIVNIRVSKMGGLRRALEAVDVARRTGVRIVVGAQVGETSLLTRAGLTVAHAAGPSLFAQEGGFGTFLLTRDVCDPPLMFGAGGRLRVADYPGHAGSGFGITMPPGAA